jgi:hypothetical protein
LALITDAPPGGSVQLPSLLQGATVNTYQDIMAPVAHLKNQPANFDAVAGMYLLDNPGTKVAVPGAISITQGKANLAPGPVKDTDSGDQAFVAFAFAATSITITQNDVANPNGNYAAVLYSMADKGDITITQGERDHDTAVVGDSDAGGNISITQGNGKGDSATVDPSVAGKDITITQGSGDGDTATVSHGYAGGDITVSQGDGNDDVATVESSNATGNVTITQGNGNYDVANALGVYAGSVDPTYGYPKDVAGTLTITQGDGYCDTINVDSQNDKDTVVNNAVLTQGNSLPFTGCTPGCGDTINVNDSDITSNLTISQGTIGVAAGNYVVNIATGGTGPVFVGGATSITQAGSSNSDFLGGNGGGDDTDEDPNEYFGFDFTTTTLDVFAGEGGDAFVAAMNVLVVYGSSVPGNPTIDAGGTGNVYEDLGNNVNVTIGNFND